MYVNFTPVVLWSWSVLTGSEHFLPKPAPTPAPAHIKSRLSAITNYFLSTGTATQVVIIKISATYKIIKHNFLMTSLVMLNFK